MIRRCGCPSRPWGGATGPLGLGERLRLAINRRLRRFSAVADRGVDGWLAERRRDRLSEGFERVMLLLYLLSRP